MKRINYAGGSAVTGDRTSEAVMRYAEALASRGSSGVIDIPALDANGFQGRAQLLLGPSSELMAATEISPHDEFDDEETLKVIHLRIEGLLRPQGLAVDDPDFESERHSQ